ncbi:hypothetical protein FB451DRAFT_1261752 [Mycena latifolia]|nr:hypothetical protein FB451DRAFT_1261752 [Mycena latifolia]
MAPDGLQLSAGHPLMEELASLRGAVARFQLSLRRLSAKLTLTESSLAEHTLALSQANTLAEKTRAAHEAYALAARARGCEEEGVLRIRELERAVREEREKGAMSERAVSAYAELVQGLEGRVHRPRRLRRPPLSLRTVVTPMAPAKTI